MRNYKLSALCALLSASTLASQTIPIRRLGAVDATSKDTVNFVSGVRELSSGAVIVNDAGARRLFLFDKSLATGKIVADSVSGSSSPYGKRASSIIPYAGDTTLLVDASARAFVVFDASGNVTGVMSPPRANDVANMVGSSMGVPRLDAKGRLVYRSALPMAFKMPEAGKPFILPDMPDSAPVVRADFDTRRADTIAWLRIPKIKGSTTPLEGGGMQIRAMINPLVSIDDWAALPDGGVAVLRGRDYHIDWFNADGSHVSSPKMPFDWRRLSDEEKASIVDSTKKAVERQFANASVAGSPAGGAADGGHGGGPAGHSLTILRLDAPDGGPAPKSGPGAGTTVSAPDVVPPSELPDYLPPIMKTGNMVADPAGNIWILPSTSAQSAGGLLYDVVNRRGELFERVRIPAGRALAGFGANGAVYMTFRDSTGQHLERASLR